MSSPGCIVSLIGSGGSWIHAQRRHRVARRKSVRKRYIGNYSCVCVNGLETMRNALSSFSEEKRMYIIYKYGYDCHSAVRSVSFFFSVWFVEV